MEASTASARERLVSIFFVVFAVCPFMLAVVLGVLAYAGVFDWGHYYFAILARRLEAAFVVLLLAIVSGWIYGRIERRFKNVRAQRVRTAAVAIATAALVIRLAYLHMYGAKLAPFDDFQWAYEAATGGEQHAHRYALFPSWGFYSMCIEAYLNVFPGGYESIQVANAVIQAMTVLLTFELTLRATERKGVAIAAATFLALYPTNVAYSALLSPETPALLLELASLIVLHFAYCSEGLLRKLLYSVLAGILLGVGELLKPISPVVLIALVVTFIFFVRRADFSKHVAAASVEDSQAGGVAAIQHGKPDTMRPPFTKGTTCLMCFALAVACFFGVKAALTTVVEDRIDEPVNPSALPHFLFVGLMHDGEGQIHLGANNHADLVLYEDAGPDYTAVNASVLGMVSEDVNEHLSEMPKLLCKKVVWAWLGDVTVFRYAQTQTGGASPFNACASYAQCAYVVLMLLASIGAFAAMRQDRRIRANLFMVAAIVFGFFLLLLISEAQARYKVVIIPFVCVFAALGLDASVRFARRRLSRRGAAQGGGVRAWHGG